MYKTSRIPVFHVPHAGDLMPGDLMESVCVSAGEFSAYHEKMKDAGVRLLLERSIYPASVVIEFGISRLLCDVERFPGPEEVMEQYGMGFCYEKAYDGKQIKNVTEALREKTMQYYLAHHKRLDTAVSRFKRVILLDLHSFSEELVLPDRKANRSMPDICIGSDISFTPSEIENKAVQLFQNAGFTTAVNYPYSGSMVPGTMMKGNAGCNLISVMIEMNRTAIIDRNGDALINITEAIRDIIRMLIDLSQDI